MTATVLGASGFIGSALAERLEAAGHTVGRPTRADLPNLRGDLGTVFYCIGMTGDFRSQPLATVDAHVAILRHILANARFESLVYLSSTRVYGTDVSGPVHESTPCAVVPSADTTYDLSKLFAESLCAAHSSRGGPRTVVARLSNVYGFEMSRATFLGSVIAEGARTGRVAIGEAPSSAKDYVALPDVLDALARLAERADTGCYNVASGCSVTHGEISAVLTALDCEVVCDPEGPIRRFPSIAVDRLDGVLDWQPRTLVDDLPDLLAHARRASCTETTGRTGARDG